MKATAKTSGTFVGVCRAVCPFYDHESRYAITCEGPVYRTTASLKFPREEERKQWVERYCCRMEGYPQCPLCQQAEKKYRE